MNSGGQIIRLTETTSTNNYTSELLRQSVIPDWTAVVASYQSSGRGQRTKSWQSDPGMNLLCTVFRKVQVAVEQQFFVSAATAVAVCDFLKAQGLAPSIKWPNDIMIDQHKVAGLLIENQVARQAIEQSIIGIGLNVNQREFDDFPWTATSLSLQTGLIYDLDVVLNGVLNALKNTMKQSFEEVHAQYTHYLFGRGKWCEVTQSGQKISGVLEGVSREGELMLRQEHVIYSYANASILSIESDDQGSSPVN